MQYKNSFFRIDVKDECTYLDLFPALNDGKKLDMNEVIDFIDSRKISDYSLDNLKKAFSILAGKPIRVKLSDTAIAPLSESAVVTISKDRMLASIRFYPPSKGGKLMTKSEILNELSLKKIKFGISEKIIDIFLKARQYCVNYPIAVGKKSVPAKDTEIEYFFDTKPLAKPKMLEDGSVDFHELNLFTKVSKGQVLAKLKRHEAGVDGMDILGNRVPCTKPKILLMKHGLNITEADDGTTLISDVDGDVTLTDGTVFVSDTYKIAADVDASTGDIDYDGNISIPGNVRTGFTVKAKGDIEVNGVVEGATLIAGGNIVIKRGVQGMGKGSLTAGGDICAQFFESANVYAKGYVNAGSILHSNVKSGGKVVVSGRKGFIVGGQIVCENSVEVNSIGNKMETQTEIKVGVRPELFDEIKSLMTNVNELKEVIDETSSYLNVYRTKIKKGATLSPENLKQIKQYSSKLEELEEEYNAKMERMREVRALIDQGKTGTVKVLGDVNIGVTIFIASRVYAVKDKLSHCVFKISDGEINPSPF